MTPERARERMIADQLETRGIRDARVLAAMQRVPRHLFVPPELRHRAYADGPLPIGHDQTISQPYIVALMTEALALPAAGGVVLEIGTGSGYQAAVLAAMGARVISLERVPELATAAGANLAAAGFAEGVRVEVGDGTLGWPASAPYAGIVVTAGGPEIPRPLLEQLAPGGALVVPVGGEEHQELVRLCRGPEGWNDEYLGGCRFVRLLGRHGWEQ